MSRLRELSGIDREAGRASSVQDIRFQTCSNNPCKRGMVGLLLHALKMAMKVCEMRDRRLKTFLNRGETGNGITLTLLGESSTLLSEPTALALSRLDASTTHRERGVRTSSQSLGPEAPEGLIGRGNSGPEKG